MESAEEKLPGGGVGGAVRVGATVRRPTGDWTPSIHALLTYLRASGLEGVPEVFGHDERGREVLSYIAGDSVEAYRAVRHSRYRAVGHSRYRAVGHSRYRDWPDWAFGDELLSQSIRWLARYHVVVSGFRPAEPMRWRSGVRELGPGEIICHNDFAPYNVIVSHGTSSDSRSSDGTSSGGPAIALEGVIDWDVAGPGRPLDDLAFAAWNFIPLFGVPKMSDSGVPKMSDTDDRYPVAEIARKLELIVFSYGKNPPSTPPPADEGQRYFPELLPFGVSAAEVLEAVVPRMERALSKIRAGAERGDEGMRNLIASGTLDWNEQAIASLRSRLPDLLAALT